MYYNFTTMLQHFFCCSVGSSREYNRLNKWIGIGSINFYVILFVSYIVGFFARLKTRRVFRFNYTKKFIGFRALFNKISFVSRYRWKNNFPNSFFSFIYSFCKVFDCPEDFEPPFLTQYTSTNCETHITSCPSGH